MRSLKNSCLLVICGLVFATAINAQAAKVSYTLHNVFLLEGEQMTGAFDWTYDIGDFEGGSGVFTALEIPYRPGSSDPPLEQDGFMITIEVNQIEMTLDGNFHDYGLDITLKFVQPFSATESATLDLETSFYECCGNGFHDQGFQSGTIALAPPVPLPAAAWLFGSALLSLVAVRRRLHNDNQRDLQTLMR